MAEDIKMNTFAPASNMEYVYAEAADGSQVKIKKSDLRRALAVVIVDDNITDLNLISETGAYIIHDHVVNIPPNSGSVMGSSLLHLEWDINAAKQLYFPFDGTPLYRYKKSGIWTGWLLL